MLTSHRARITATATAFAAAVGLYLGCLYGLGWPRIGVWQAASIVLIFVTALLLWAALDDAHHDTDESPSVLPAGNTNDDTDTAAAEVTDIRTARSP